MDNLREAVLAECEYTWMGNISRQKGFLLGNNPQIKNLVLFLNGNAHNLWGPQEASQLRKHSRWLG